MDDLRPSPVPIKDGGSSSGQAIVLPQPPEEKKERARRYCYRNVLPFLAIIAVECGSVGVNVLFKAASSKGMSYYVFITYASAIATLLLLPLPFIFYRRVVLLPLKFRLISRICLLGLFGIAAHVCLYRGIEYSSATLASVVSNLVPAFTFILAVLFRMEKVALRSLSTQAKIIGTIVSISGALVVVLYKGPKVFSSSRWTSSSLSSSSVLLHWLLESLPKPNWVIGGVLISVAKLLISFWYIIQTQVMEIYPQELIVAFFYLLCATFIAIAVSLIAESNMSSWKLTSRIAVVAVLCSGVLSSIGAIVHIWAIHLKGPVYVVIFKPLSIAIAAFLSAIFLGDTLHLGSVIGAIIVIIGFYAVIWGKAKEEERIDDDKAPLLQSHVVEDI